jgi:predicted membrane metal-binding protein
VSTATDPHLSTGDQKPGSDRSFGLVFAAVFALFGCWPVLAGRAPHWIALAIAAAFGLAALAAPRMLHPLNALWFRLGLLLHRVVSPLVMGAVFFLCVTPIGLIMRMRGKDLLSLRREDGSRTYWVVRDPAGPDPATMTKQF